MNGLTIILALLIGLLSVLPCCFNDNCTSEGILIAQTEGHEEEADVCSPFYSCSTCIGFTISNIAAVPAVAIVDDITYFSPIRFNPIPPFYHAIWQPPKLS